jgi:hypothetical protein
MGEKGGGVRQVVCSTNERERQHDFVSGICEMEQSATFGPIHQSYVKGHTRTPPRHTSTTHRQQTVGYKGLHIALQLYVLLLHLDKQWAA